MDRNHKIKVGGKYRNMHTMELCTVVSKCFSMVEYKEDSGHRSSIHYKTFKKHWLEMVQRENLPWGCRKCGLDCTSNGGSQWLSHSCDKQYKVKPVDVLEVCRDA
jgi:hypothetical protein